MKSLRLRCVLPLAVVSLLIAAAAPNAARAATVITTAPYTITAAGEYELGNNINYSGTSGTIIQINASNVTIDFKNFFISGPVGNSAQTVSGINANERSNLVIKNGTIAFCQAGIVISGNNQANTNNVGHRIENMRITYCYQYGVDLLFPAPGARVSDCQISKIGGTSVTADANCTAIVATGAGVTINDNVISEVSGSGNGSGRGIATVTGVFAFGNTISNADVGINGGKYQNNLTFSCTTPFTGGTDAGSNN